MLAASEETLNRLLRRSDWRFLLPDPWPAQALCFATGSLSDATAAIATRLSGPQAASDGDIDLAVAADADAETLSQAYQGLRPGGALYSEWYSRSKSSPATVKKALELARFEQVRLYWPWPSPQHNSPSFWLPMNAPAALDYFLEHRPHARRGWRRHGRRVLRSRWGRRIALGLVRPICAVATKPFPPNSPVTSCNGQVSGPHGDWLSSVLLNVRAIHLEHGSDLVRLLMTGGERSINKPVMLVFEGQQTRPLCAIKFTRVPESIPGLQHELSALRVVEREAHVSGVPRALFSHASHNSLAVGQTVVEGSPLYSVLSHGNFHNLALQGTNWLLGLVRNDKQSPQAEWWPRLAQPAIDAFSRSFGPVLQPDLFVRIEEELRRLPSLPRAIEHRDFSPWNVLLNSASEIRVLDWESAELDGLAGLDLIYFLTFLTLFRDGAMTRDTVASYRSMLDPASEAGRTFERCVSDYGDRVGIAAKSWKALRILTWLLHSHSEYSRMQADRGRPPAAEELRSSTFLNFLMEDLKEPCH